MHDSTPPPDLTAALPDAALDSMRHAMAAYLERPAETAALRAALRDISSEAQARHLRAETLIVALKHVWHSVPNVQNAPTQQDRDRLLDRLITACIEEYYSR